MKIKILYFFIIFLTSFTLIVSDGCFAKVDAGLGFITNFGLKLFKKNKIKKKNNTNRILNNKNGEGRNLRTRHRKNSTSNKTGSNREIINNKYAGKKYPSENLPLHLQKKYPNSVMFDKNGYPDFSPYSIKTIKLNNLNGNYAHDVTLANKKAGYSRTPDGYTWHHHQDGKTIQLVPSDLHASIRHTGGASKLRSKN